MDAEEKLNAIRALVLGLDQADPPEPPTPPEDTYGEELCAWAKDLPPGLKIEIIKAMGFTAMASDHGWDCPHQMGAGLVCQCVPPATVWNQPADVNTFRGETWKLRLERAQNGPERIIPACER